MNAQRLLASLLHRLRTTAYVALTALLLAGAGSTSALTINLNFTNDASFLSAGLTAGDIVSMKAACAFAASMISSNFTDPINVNINIRAAAGTGTLGASSTRLTVVTYATMRTKMLAETNTADDAISTAPGGSVPAADPQPAGHWLVSRAQAKALGITADDLTLDGTFTFGGGHVYTYDPNNRAVAGKIDYIGVCLHEFTEIMGRIFLMGQNLDGFPDYMLLDMFHFTAPGTHSFTSGAGRYFSIDNGTNNLKNFNNFDLNGGDAQDYASGANDSFNAFSSSGVKNDLTEVGLRNMDVIGYNRVGGTTITIPVAVDATNLTWTTGGTTPWSGQAGVTHDGVDAAQSGAIGDLQTSFVETTVTGPSTLSFWWKVSSELNFDFLTVTLDGVTNGIPTNSISGEVGFVLASVAIPAGAHPVRWTYSKDINTIGGSDAAWLDGVTNTPSAVAPVLAAIEAGALAYTENQAATAVTATLTVSDADSANLASGSVSITANFASGQDVLAMSPNPQNGITATYNAGTGVLSLSGSSSVANYQTALRTVRYSNSSDNPSTATRTATFLVNDGTANSNPQARNITVAAVNDAPVLASIEVGALAYTENQAATAITATITAADADNANLASGSVSITANFASGQDVLAMSPNPQNGITATYNAGTGVLSLSGSATVANYQTALRTVTYFNSSQSPSTLTRTVSFVVNDGAVNSSAQTRNVTVATVNDVPTLAAIEAGALAYTENQAATLITATLTAADLDNANLASGSVSITANFASGQDVLAMSPNPQNGITASYNAGTGVLSLSGSATVANYQAALRSVSYFNSSENPSTATRTVSFVVNDGAANSGSQTRNITVAGVNDAPVLANIEAGALAYAANQVATAVTASLTASDVDNANLASGSVSITANFASGQDVLGMSPNPQNGITATYNAATGVLSLSGSSTVANYQTALRNVTYFNSSASPSIATRTVSFLVNDGAVNSNPQTRNINVTGAGLIPPVTPTNGGIASILLFVDNVVVPSPYKTALDSAGLSYQYFTTEAPFNAALAASSPPSTLAIVDSTANNHDFAPLVSFVANCGRSILYHWDLDGEAALAASLNVSTVQDIFTPVPVNDWGGSFFFSHVSSPLALFESGPNDDGDKLQPTPGGVAVAGHTASATNGQACVVIGNSGRTIVNSMALQDATNAPTQAAQFALNEIFYLLAPAHGGGRVAVLGAEVNVSWNEDVRQKLLATAAFEAVDIIQANTLTPTLAQLRPYSAVLVYSDNNFNNTNTLGNVLADYVDAGGGVVLNTFALYNQAGLNVAGRLSTGGYLPFVPGTFATAADLTLVADQAVHPILAGVGSLVGGTSSYHNIATVAPNADLIAHWSNGRPLVMTKVTGQGRVVGLNFFPPSETVRVDLWRTNSAGGLLMANALRWSAVPDCTLKTNYVEAMTFAATGLDDITVSLAFDGTNFWAASGASAGGNKLARYTAAGVLVGSFAPGIDFRSLFTDAGGRLYARGYNDPDILRQTTPGTFVTHVTLAGGSLDQQAAVVLNGSANEYVALNAGLVNRWSTNGSFLGTVTLAGFGAVAGENAIYQNVRLAAVGNSWLTYNANRVVSIWNQSGARIATTTLQNAGVGSLEAQLTLSYCAGQVFINDATGGLWSGYDICTSPERPYLSRPVRLAGGQFQMDLHAAPARSYTIERTTNFTSWTPFLTNTPLAPNTTITDTGAAGTYLIYRARTH